MRIHRSSALSFIVMAALLGCALSSPDVAGPTHAVAYDPNGATSGSAPTDAAQYKSNATVTVLGNMGNLAKAGCAFAGWMTASDGTGASYAVGATFAMGAADVTLNAVWIPTDLTFTSAGSTITITGYPATTAPVGGLTIPIGVTALAGGAFISCNGLTSVAIPPSVNAIDTGSNAWQGVFPWCANLASFAVDSANQYYKSVSGVLYDKSGATLVEVPGGIVAGPFSVPSGVTSIANDAFTGCNGLTSVSIPASVASIAAWYFQGCSNVATITVDPANQSYQSINGVLFDKAGKTLIQAPEKLAIAAYAVPAGVTKITEWAFSGCRGINSISIPTSVADIEPSALASAFGLTAISVDPANPYYAAASQVLLNKAGTTLLQMPAGIGGAYSIPSGVTNIARDSFNGCLTLSSVTIPPSVASIGDSIDGSFSGCVSLASITVQATTPPALHPANAGGMKEFSNCAASLQIHVPSGSLASYQTAAGWVDYASILVSP